MTHKYHRRFVDRIEDRDPSVMWMDDGDGYVIPHGDKYIAMANRFGVVRDADILFQTHLLGFGKRVRHGCLVEKTTPAWSALRKEVLTAPSLLTEFPTWHRKFEEFVAGTYVAADWTDVMLSPVSGDHGFDIAASKRGRQVLDEAKAYGPCYLVGHQVVRAALGLLIQHRDVHQVRVTTTSRFAPLIWSEFDDQIPEQLMLRDRQGLLRWLRSIRGGCLRF